MPSRHLLQLEPAGPAALELLQRSAPPLQRAAYPATPGQAAQQNQQHAAQQAQQAQPCTSEELASIMDLLAGPWGACSGLAVQHAELELAAEFRAEGAKQRKLERRRRTWDAPPATGAAPAPCMQPRKQPPMDIAAELLEQQAAALVQQSVSLHHHWQQQLAAAPVQQQSAACLGNCSDPVLLAGIGMPKLSVRTPAATPLHSIQQRRAQGGALRSDPAWLPAGPARSLPASPLTSLP